MWRPRGGSSAACPPAFYATLGVPGSARCPGLSLLGFATVAAFLPWFVAFLLEGGVCWSLERPVVVTRLQVLPKINHFDAQNFPHWCRRSLREHSPDREGRVG